MGFMFGQGRRAMLRAVAAEDDLADILASEDGAGEDGPAKPALKKHLLRMGLTLAVSALFATLLSQRLADLDFAATWGAVVSVSAWAWAAALGLTALAFWAVGHYDAVLHRHFETGVNPRAARAAGISAIAVSQTLGLGVVTGAILRWRMLPDHGFWLASRITVAVALSFLAAWGVITAAAMTVFDFQSYSAIAAVVLIAAALLAALCVIAPPAPFRWPNGFTLAALLALSAVDTLAAAGALYFLLPADIAQPIALFLPAFLIAYGAGLLSGAPAGLGAFELTLLALLPHMPVPELIAAILCWRLAYFALPAMLGAVLAMRGPNPRLIARAPAPLRPNLPARLAPHAPAEYGLLEQGEHGVLDMGAAAWMVAPRGHMLLGLLDPALGGRCAASREAALQGLTQAAASAARWPAAYKLGARSAAHAAAHGWRAMRISREAVLHPARFDLSTPARAHLRRKLRRAEGAGVSVQHIAPAALPIAELSAIAQVWAAAHGGERGFSMGRFAPDYLRRQRVYIARKEGAVIAFASFHETAQEWVLDLMRGAQGLPDGTMHALVQAALVDAQRLNVPRLSLAAAPEAAFARGRAAKALRLMAPLLRALRLDIGHGLRQFKDSFAPHWQPRYLCAPHLPALALASLSIARAVAFPRALAQTQGDGAKSEATLDNPFALPPTIWHGHGNISAN